MPERKAEAVKTPKFLDLGVKLAYDFKLYKTVDLQLSGGVQNILEAYQKDFDRGANRDYKPVSLPALPPLLWHPDHYYVISPEHRLHDYKVHPAQRHLSVLCRILLSENYNMWGYDRHTDQTVNIYSAFLQNEWKNERWSILVGGRLDKHNMVDNIIFSPRANPACTCNKER